MQRPDLSSKLNLGVRLSFEYFFPFLFSNGGDRVVIVVSYHVEDTAGKTQDSKGTVEGRKGRPLEQCF